ncbi:MAG: transposase [Rhizobiales bacterium]|nr:transposase [Hyphomicrobiales bacterium]
MTDFNDANTDTIYIAIDVAKYKHDVLICFPDGKQRSLTIQNTLKGYQSILDACKCFDDAKRVCGFEPTADYHRNIAYWLAQNACETRLISSLACARAREMLYKTWDKHDRKDAQVILYLLEQQISEPFYDPLLEGNMDTQEICNTYQQISLARSRCWHSLLNHYLRKL